MEVKLHRFDSVGNFTVQRQLGLASEKIGRTKMQSEALDFDLPGRKLIHAAPVLIVQPDPELARDWYAALSDFGMRSVRMASDIETAMSIVREIQPAAIIIAVTPLADAGEMLGRLRYESGVELDHVPAAVLLRQMSRHERSLAARVGFVMVVAEPTTPRLIYRRMGSLMQKARYAARNRGREVEKGGGPKT